MSIERVDGTGIRPAAEKRSAEGRPASPATPGRPEADPRDSVELSRGAQRLADLERAARELPELRQERIADLRRQLAEGTYAPDPRAVARAILEFEDGLGI